MTQTRTSVRSEPRSAVETQLTWRCINTIRVLAMDAVEQAQSGHPGTPMALAPVGWLLWTRHLKHDPAGPDWPDRDRFVLSAGHASMLLYGLLHLTGYDLPLEEIRNFRQWESRTPGHPEHGHTVGVETTTGPLGQGIGNAIGMAVAEQLLASRFNRPGLEIVDHRTWVIASDGDMMEGVSSEVASLAGHLKLGKLKVIYDDNRITIDGETARCFSEDVGKRFEAYGWKVLRVPDGNDLRAIDRALTDAAEETERPTLIILPTVIGYPAPTRQNTAKAHGEPLGKEEVRKTKELLGWPPDETFLIPAEVAEEAPPIRARGAKLRREWEERMAEYRRTQPELGKEFDAMLAGTISVDWDSVLPSFSPGTDLATRQASAQVLEKLIPLVPTLVGGSADLATSTGTSLKASPLFEPGKPGRSLAWGVREHAMGTMMSGMALHGGMRPYGGTFLIFSDYMRPSIRLAALMQVPVIYLFTHDSIGLGEDGPTHQPVEHLASLRAIPNLVVIRPADAAETAHAWRVALERQNGPTAIILTRQKLPVPDRAAGSLGSAGGLTRGGYVLLEPGGGPPQAILLATGSEVRVALEAAQRLARGDGGAPVRTRVVSFPSWELFRQAPQSYRDEVLPPAVGARVAIEAGASLGWREWITDAGAVIALDRFGASAPGDRILRELGFTPEAAMAAVRRVVGDIPS
ncbi:MAG: transketolase [Gemmatimonadales bacterium]